MSAQLEGCIKRLREFIDLHDWHILDNYPRQFQAVADRDFDVVLATLAAQDEHIEELEGLLKKLEYIQYPEELTGDYRNAYYQAYKFCPECGYKQPDGHWKDCGVAKALYGSQGTDAVALGGE